MSAADVDKAVRAAQAFGRTEVDDVWLAEQGYDADADTVNDALYAAEYERDAARFDWGDEPAEAEPAEHEQAAAELPAGVVGDAEYEAEVTPQLSDEDAAALAQNEAEAAAEHEQRMPMPDARLSVDGAPVLYLVAGRLYTDEAAAEAALAVEVEAGHAARLVRYVAEADNRHRCQWDGCSAPLPNTGVGRPRSFCVRHKKAADAARKRRAREQRAIDREDNWATRIGEAS